MTVITHDEEFGLSQEQAQDTLFNRITVALLVLSMGFAVFVQYTNLPERTRADKEQLPPQLLKIIERKPTVVAKPEPITIEPVPLEEAIEPTVETDKVAESDTEQATDTERAQAKAKAKKSGILAFANDLNKLHQNVISTSFDNNRAVQQKQSNKAQSQSALANSESNNALSRLAFETSNDLTSNNADAIESALRLSSEQSTGSIGAVDEQRSQVMHKKDFKVAVASSTSASSELALVLTQLQQQTEADMTPSILERDSKKPVNIIPTADNIPDERTTESIRQIFDKNKGALYAIYRRALRVDPSLAGKLTVDLTITADGTVKTVDLVLSELAFAELENKLMTRISMINFGPMGLNDIRLNYTFNFLPF
jgi:hypothetical protein